MRALNEATSSLIDLIEVAYDLELSDSDWLPAIMNAGGALFDQGLGILAVDFVHPPADGGGEQVVINSTHLRSLPDDYPEQLEAAMRLIPPGVFQKVAPPGYAGTWTEISEDYPEISKACLEALGCADLLGIFASDPNGVGVHIHAPMPEATRLTPKARERWQMLGAHIAAAFRLRQGLKMLAADSRRAHTDLPRNAEAVLDLEDFQIVGRAGRAEGNRVLKTLRGAARSVDQARGGLRREDPQKALEIWKSLTGGRWTMVDWFDTDGRRFVLAIPNSPELGDPRGLTDQESQVVNYLLLGDTSKLVAYRLGISSSRVSGLLKSAMRKLGVSTRAQLIEKLRPFVPQERPEGDG